MVAFCYILDTSRINAGTVFALNSNKVPKEINSFDFGWSLAIKLIIPLIQQRSLVGLQLPKKRKIKEVLQYVGLPTDVELLATSNFSVHPVKAQR